MNDIIKRPYRCLVDFQEVYEFMLEIYTVDWRNGEPAPSFEYSQLLYWSDHTQSHRIALWEKNGQIVGLCWYDGQIGEALFNLRPDYEMIIPDMIQHAKEQLCKEDGSVQLRIIKGQKNLIKEVQRQGFELIKERPEGIYDFSVNKLNYTLPSGFYFEPLACCNRKRLQNATWRGFDNTGESEGGVETAHHLDTAPHRTSELDVVIKNDTGEYVCYASMWMVKGNHLAYLEPLCTVPEYRRKGLAAAALSELVRRTKPLGATHMTGGSNDFYFKIGYDPIITWTIWKNPSPKK